MKESDFKLDIDMIDKAFSFYNIDEKYKHQSYTCAQEILNNENFRIKFLNLYRTLFESNSEDLSQLWSIKDVDSLFGENVYPFVTNLMILSGMPVHKRKMEEVGFDRKQIEYHKEKVKECFINDLENRGYEGIRISQMLWATYFINCRNIGAGILQYEYDISIDKIKIHIPRVSKLDFDKVKKSLYESQTLIKKYFHLDEFQYICNSWLLSKQLTGILDDESNIKKFQSLFKIKDGENCIDDILNFVYNTKKCDDLSLLAENSSLQKKIKQELMMGTVFKLGCGELTFLSK